MAVSLGGHDALLDCREKPLPFVQRQTQVGDIAKTVRLGKLYHVEASGLTSSTSVSTNRKTHAIREPQAGNIFGRS